MFQITLKVSKLSSRKALSEALRTKQFEMVSQTIFQTQTIDNLAVQPSFSLNQ